jgi:hypothetical protein
MVRWGYGSDGGCQDYGRLKKERIFTFCYSARPVRASAESNRIEDIRLYRMKTADTSGIQDYHWIGLAISEECFETRSFSSFQSPKVPQRTRGSNPWRSQHRLSIHLYLWMRDEWCTMQPYPIETSMFSSII